MSLPGLGGSDGEVDREDPAVQIDEGAAVEAERIVDGNILFLKGLAGPADEPGRAGEEDRLFTAGGRRQRQRKRNEGQKNIGFHAGLDGKPRLSTPAGQ